MKKLIALLLITFTFAIVAEAQVTRMLNTIPSRAGAAPSGLDSTRNISTASTYLYVKPTSNCLAGSIQYYAKRYSASMGGTIVLQASNDGLNYYQLENFATDTLTISNAATDAKLINLTPAQGINYQYYRIKCTGASGDTATVRAWWFCR